MSEWIKLDPRAFSAKARQTRRQGGIEIAVTLSPYDIPDAVRGQFDEHLSKFVIDFNYIEDEDWERHTSNEGIQLRVGKNSGRLYGIEVDVATLNAGQVALRLELPKLVGKAIEAELSATKLFSRKENYRLAKSVISNQREPLFAGIG